MPSTPTSTPRSRLIHSLLAIHLVRSASLQPVAHHPYSIALIPDHTLSSLESRRSPLCLSAVQPSSSFDSHSFAFCRPSSESALGSAAPAVSSEGASGHRAQLAIHVDPWIVLNLPARFASSNHARHPPCAFVSMVLVDSYSKPATSTFSSHQAASTSLCLAPRSGSPLSLWTHVGSTRGRLHPWKRPRFTSLPPAFVRQTPSPSLSRERREHTAALTQGGRTGRLTPSHPARLPGAREASHERPIVQVCSRPSRMIAPLVHSCGLAFVLYHLSGHSPMLLGVHFNQRDKQHEQRVKARTVEIFVPSRIRLLNCSIG
ncbi:hypothetical protein OH76DRAFT_94995 [Lentinus brumalis]|uniref:Uncharacterized protein n=1 Tax=Lentinus brumalis TaxID=2498619 RepID=A0A371CQP5_9APHY|nr:hypothetical protein OH76DRAFT_94995 [Polyporus brumalis]